MIELEIGENRNSKPANYQFVILEETSDFSAAKSQVPFRMTNNLGVLNSIIQ